MATVVRNMLLSLIPMINIERSLIDPTTKKRNLDLVFLYLKDLNKLMISVGNLMLYNGHNMW